MAKITGTAARVDKVKHRRKGIHSKSKTSSLKTSKHYRKAYRGQGRYLSISFSILLLHSNLMIQLVRIHIQNQNILLSY